MFKGIDVLKTLDCQHPISNIVVFYPGDSLTEQVAAWIEGHPDCSLETSLARSLPGIRKALRNADVALLDATADPSRAWEAFSQAVARLGACSVAVYTETMHAWLELAVRIRGVLLLLGPLSSGQWEGFFERMLQSSRRLRTAGFVAQRPPRAARPEDSGLREQPARTQLPAGFRRPKTGVK